jgi:hypothetical protein
MECLASCGVIENRADVLMRLVERLGRGGQQLHFCYEAGPCLSASSSVADVTTFQGALPWLMRTRYANARNVVGFAEG